MQKSTQQLAAKIEAEIAEQEDVIAKLKAAFPDHPLCVESAAQSSTSFGEAEEVIEQNDAVPVSLQMVQQTFDF